MFFGLLLQDALRLGGDRLTAELVDEVPDGISLVEVPLDGAGFVPEIVPPEVVVLNDISCFKPENELVEHTEALGVVPVWRKAHRLAFAIAVPPSERLGDIRVKPTE